MNIRFSGVYITSKATRQEALQTLATQPGFESPDSRIHTHYKGSGQNPWFGLLIDGADAVDFQQKKDAGLLQNSLSPEFEYWGRYGSVPGNYQTL